jgi:hypothetical protein
MFGRMGLARAQLAARRNPDWRNAVDYGERAVDGERFLFAYCRFCAESRFCAERLAVSLRRYDPTRAERRLRFSVEHHLLAGCPVQPFRALFGAAVQMITEPRELLARHPTATGTVRQIPGRPASAHVPDGASEDESG